MKEEQKDYWLAVLNEAIQNWHNSEDDDYEIEEEVMRKLTIGNVAYGSIPVDSDELIERCKISQQKLDGGEWDVILLDIQNGKYNTPEILKTMAAKILSLWY